ncbi:MAG: MFS transporter [Burkholderiaceae bacterium]
MTASQVRFAVLVIGLGTLIAPLDTAVNVAFPAITEAFEIPISEIQWIITMFGLAQVSLTLVFGKLGDRYGHRRVFMAGLLFSAVALALCAAASTYASLVTMRVLQGVGAGLVMACGPALVTIILPPDQRRQALAFYTLFMGLGMFLGPLLGGALVQSVGWPGVYWARIPIALLAFALVWRMRELEDNPALKTARAQARLAPLDLAGLGAVVLALTAIIFLIVQMRAPFFGVISLVVAAFVAGAAGVFLSQRNTKEIDPIINLSLFANLRFTTLQVAAILVQAMTFSLLLLMPYRFSIWPQVNLFEAGLALAMFPGGMVLAGAFGSVLTARIRSDHLVVAGMLVAAIGLFACAVFSEREQLLLTTLAMAVTGLGQGLFQVGHLDATVETMPLADRGVAGSLVSVDRVLGFALSANGVMWLHDILRDGSSSPANYSSTLQVVSLTLLLITLVTLFGLRRRRPLSN